MSAAQWIVVRMTRLADFLAVRQTGTVAVAIWLLAANPTGRGETSSVSSSDTSRGVAQATASQDAPSQQPPITPYHAVNVLRLIDPDKHALRGKWLQENGALVSTDRPECRLEVPYELPEQYELWMVIVRVRGDNALNVGLHTGSTRCIVSLDRTRGGYSSGLGRLDGKPSYFRSNETYYPKAVFRNGEEHKIRHGGQLLTFDASSRRAVR